MMDGMTRFTDDELAAWVSKNYLPLLPDGAPDRAREVGIAARVKSVIAAVRGGGTP